MSTCCFFLKQKTAYEMRISDWSSDVCASDLREVGIPHDLGRRRAALASTAKFLPGVEARAQGHGLIQVEDAWEALQRARDWNPPRFSIQAPLVGAETRAEGPERFTGRGLFELSGWRPGQSGRRAITLTRTGGDVGRDHYRLRWKGDEIGRAVWGGRVFE